MIASRVREIQKSRRLALLTAVVGVGFAGVIPAIARADAPASPSQPTTADLLKQIQTLQSQVQELQVKQTQQSAVDTKLVDDTVERVLQDADKRSRLLQVEGFTAGYDKGRFTLKSSDGAFSFSPMAQLQIRYATSYDTGGDGNTQSGFEIRRMKFGFDGTAFSPDLYYFVLWNTANGGTNAGNLNLEEAWLKYKFADDWSVRGGQFTTPVIKEQTISSKRQLTVDRSLVNQIITGTNQAWEQGATLIYQPPKSQLRVEAGITDGYNTFNTNYLDEPANTTDFGALGRIDYFVFGDPADTAQFTSLKDKKDLLVVGGGAEFTEGGSTNSVIHTADVQYDNTDGLALYGAYLANYITNDTGNTYNYGVLGQIGYLFPNQTNWEVFGRYDFTHLDHAATIGTSTEDNFHEITVGVNYYVYGHNAKFTVDGTYLPNGTPGATGIDQTGTTDDEFTLRAQFQLLL